MNVNSKRSVTDEQNERHKRLLASILKEEGNKSCADCKTRNPTWASVNLGVFVCLTCSGIHRSLGVHISQVRSCNLDTWLPKQVEFCRVMGNIKGNRYWEARLPKDFRRPPSGNPNPELASFIRAKYVDRAYAASDVHPPTIDNYLEHPYAKDEEASTAAPAAPPATAVAEPARLMPSKASASSPALMMDLLGGFDEFTSSAAPAIPPPPPAAASSDPFGMFVSAPTPSNGPSIQRNSLEWTDFCAAPSSSSAGPPAAGPAPVQQVLASGGHHRSHSISEGVPTPSASASFSGQPSRFSAQGRTSDVPSSSSHGPHHAGHHSRNHSHTSQGRSNGPSVDPFAVTPPDDLLAGLTIHHVMESMTSPIGTTIKSAAVSAASDPFQFSSSAMPGEHALPAPGAGHKRHPSLGRKAGEEALRLFDAAPSTASASVSAVQGGGADDPFGDFLSAGPLGPAAYQNGGLKLAQPQQHVQVHAGVNGLAGGDMASLL